MSGECGLDSVGVCSPEPFNFDMTAISSMVESGRNASMAFTFGRPARSTNPRATYPYANSLIVGVRAYGPTSSHRNTPEAWVASYARRDEYAALRESLGVLASFLREWGYRAQVVADENSLVDKAIARRAGVGWIGKNTLLLSPRLGPFVLLGTVVTDAKIDSGASIQRRSCGSCDACVTACPTGALDGAGALDARRCLAWLLQQEGEFPQEFREILGTRIYGCDDCLTSCPVGTRSAQSRPEAPSALGGASLLDLLRLNDEDLLQAASHLYVPKRRASHLRRNLLLALGNSHPPPLGAEAILLGYLNAPDPVLAEHAAWALRRQQSQGGLAAETEVDTARG